LARIATLGYDPETATQLFQKALELNPEPQVKAWTLVYLGRLAQASQDGGGRAVQYFQDAVGVEGASAGALQAACEALDRPRKPWSEVPVPLQVPAKCAEILKPR
jgi:hypothetical protein